MKNLSVTVRVKQKFRDRILFKFLLFLSSFGILNPKTTVNIANKRIAKGSFMYRINTSKWEMLETNKKITIN